MPFALLLLVASPLAASLRLERCGDFAGFSGLNDSLVSCWQDEIALPEPLAMNISLHWAFSERAASALLLGLPLPQEVDWIAGVLACQPAAGAPAAGPALPPRAEGSCASLARPVAAVAFPQYAYPQEVPPLRNATALVVKRSSSSDATDGGAAGEPRRLPKEASAQGCMPVALDTLASLQQPPWCAQSPLPQA